MCVYREYFRLGQLPVEINPEVQAIFDQYQARHLPQGVVAVARCLKPIHNNVVPSNALETSISWHTKPTKARLPQKVSLRICQRVKDCNMAEENPANHEHLDHPEENR